MKDYLVKGYAFGGTVRVYTARTTNLVAEAQKRHNLWPTSTAALGRLLTSSVIMGAMYKGDQELTIRVDSDGPIGGMVATTNTLGEVRGYVGNPHVFLQYNNGKLNVGQAVGNGFIHVTKDLKVRDMFTSSSEIITGEIAEDFAYYFTSSEQIPSAVGLGVLVNTDNTVAASGGFILQVMPGCKSETIDKIEKIGIDKAKAVIQKAELILFVLDNNQDLSPEDEALLELTSDKKRIIIINKIDLGSEQKHKFSKSIQISALYKTGISDLENMIKEMFLSGQINSTDQTYLSNARHIAKLTETQKSLCDSLQAIKDELPIDMVEIDLKNAWSTLGEIIGDTSSTSLLDELFSNFCLGK